MVGLLCNALENLVEFLFKLFAIIGVIALVLFLSGDYLLLEINGKTVYEKGVTGYGQETNFSCYQTA